VQPVVVATKKVQARRVVLPLFPLLTQVLLRALTSTGRGLVCFPVLGVVRLILTYLFQEVYLMCWPKQATID
jgi:dolichol kinase